mmetsp:Transcript_62783/g.147726  ORF Transcript_62783/g.147726 Transcript_62783/m.147726 type:complete len:256 (+) Transcript_62783:1944-2711(+)
MERLAVPGVAVFASLALRVTCPSRTHHVLIPPPKRLHRHHTGASFTRGSEWAPEAPLADGSASLCACVDGHACLHAQLQAHWLQAVGVGWALHALISLWVVFRSDQKVTCRTRVDPEDCRRPHALDSELRALPLCTGDQGLEAAFARAARAARARSAAASRTGAIEAEVKGGQRVVGRRAWGAGGLAGRSVEQDVADWAVDERDDARVRDNKVPLAALSFGRSEQHIVLLRQSDFCLDVQLLQHDRLQLVRDASC